MIADRNSTPVRRAHLMLPIFDESNELVLDVTVTALDETGATVTPEAWSGPLDLDSTVDWPITFANGVIDLWLTEPGRYTLRCENVGRNFSTLLPGANIELAPELSVNLADGGWWIKGVKAPGSWLQAPRANPSLVRWVQPPLIGPHQHSGTQPGSTILNGGMVVDGSVDQTWLGYEAGEAGLKSDTTAVGEQAIPNGTQSVVVGPESGTTGAASTVVGPSSQASQDGSVTLGGDHEATFSKGVLANKDSGGGETFFVDVSTLALRESVSVQPTISTFGFSLPVPGTLPTGASQPIWFLSSQTVIPGRLKTLGSATLGAADSTVGFFGSTGATKTTIDPSQSTGALHSLLAALKNYNLV